MTGRGRYADKRPHSIWDLPELVECIIYQLPIEDILLDQRVCSGWKALISGSPRLQEALFLKPKQAGASNSDQAIRRLNPLLARKFPPFLPANERSPMSENCAFLDRDIPWSGDASRLAFLRPEASWRRMLLAQPPLKIFEQVKSRLGMGGGLHSVGTVTIPDGLRMGFIYDKAYVALWVRVGTFYTITDDAPGRWSFTKDGSRYPETSWTGQGSSFTNEKPKGQRVFGGEGKYTLVCTEVVQCTNSPPQSSRKLMRSSGFNNAELEMAPLQSSPRGRNLWSRDGLLWA